MTTAPTTAAAIDAAALRACLLSAESQLAHRIAIGRLEDAPALQLPEHSGRGMRGDCWFEMTASGASYHQLGQAPVKTWTAAKLIADVLELRAEDPDAAHQRDITTARQRIQSYLSSYENDCRRLGDPTHPAYRDPAKATEAQRYSEFSEVGGAVLGRDRASTQIAKGLAQLQGLIAAGPHVPNQGRLF
ncbi:MAG: hypothetical protein REI11_08220 [Patulibacter sp.]|nr:hypothetical protein [Patulibacter sp.]